MLKIPTLCNTLLHKNGLIPSSKLRSSEDTQSHPSPGKFVYLLPSVIKKFRCLLLRCVTTGSESQGSHRPLKDSSTKDGDCTRRKVSSLSETEPSFYHCQPYGCPPVRQRTEPFLACVPSAGLKVQLRVQNLQLLRELGKPCRD